MDAFRNVGALFGRFLLGTIFFTSGIFKLGALSATAQHMAAHGMTHMVWTLALLAGLVETVGGGMLIGGAMSQWAALLLFFFLVPVTLVFHSGPTIDDRVNLMKNLAIMGGLLMVVTQGGGGWSVDSLRGKLFGNSERRAA